VTPAGEMIALIESRHPGWQVWTVHRYIGGILWCARKHGERTARFDASSAQELENYIITAEQEGT
jgi:hypothetical protein